MISDKTITLMLSYAFEVTLLISALAVMVDMYGVPEPLQPMLARVSQSTRRTATWLLIPITRNRLFIAQK